ncbi:uncharacterized protein LOC131943554 [Physella acuta]|uniref:uncharacterized protein LOC131943554 n=1 Tax=Physella acuta TaxID=109671 RepID=UPI0027DBB2A9|nr:uncharacterized protein LOC131943554 [Physella acuta]
MTSVTLVCAGLLVFVLGVSAQSYTLEMTVFVENGLTLNEMSKTPSTTYGNLRQQAQDSLVKDILYMGSEVNKALATMSQYGLNIDLRLKQVVFLNIDVMTTYMDGTTNVIDSALGKLLFQNFLTQQNAYATYGYDYALLLTK